MPQIAALLALQMQPSDALPGPEPPERGCPSLAGFPIRLEGVRRAGWAWSLPLRLGMAHPESIRGPASDVMGRFRELLTKFDTAMFVTRRTGLEFHGRPMAIAHVEPDATLWFVTSIDAPKLVELAADPLALVCMQGNSRFVTINGRIDVVRDAKKIDEMWRESFRVWFDGKDDPKLVLLKLSAIEAEYWDQSGIRGLKYAFRAAKALIKDERVNPAADEPEAHGSIKL